MGLDMYLTKKHYVQNWEFKKPEEQYEITIKKGGEVDPSINTSKISYIETEVMYWRKANHIHKWFVDNCQDGNDDCGTYYISREKLNDLYSVCKEVIKSAKLIPGKIHNGTQWKNGKATELFIDGLIISNPATAEELLPTAEGFFFGGTDYDEYYLDDIKETAEMLERELAIEDNRADYYYHSSW